MIGLITDYVRDKPTGVGSYAKEFIKTLFKIDKRHSYKFIDYERNHFNKNNLIYIKNYTNKFKTNLWHNILPLRLKTLNVDYVVNFSGCPHWLPYKQREIVFIYDISWYFYPHFHPLGRVMIYHILIGRAIRNAYRIVVDSYHTKKDLIKHYHVSSDKILVVYPFLPRVIENEKKPTFYNDFPFILFIGTLEPRKNIKTLIKAFYKLKRQASVKHKLLISGKDGWKFSGMYKLVKQLDLSEDIIFTGYISDEEKKYLYKKADFFVYPSFYEGFGIPVLEALSYGCPVITSNVSSLPEVVGNAGLLVNPFSVDDLYSSMLKLIKDKELKKKFIAEGYKQAKKFLNRNQIRQLVKIFDNKTNNE